jgi:methionyl-tRNA formyltransferase
MSRHYLVAAIKPWNIEAFKRRSKDLPGTWRLISCPQELITVATDISPRYIFFPHWSWRVPAEVWGRNECVCFHMTDLPYGRGGSPLQNLIARGHTHTVLSALRMADELDAGPIYLKRQLSLAGRAEEIYLRAAELVYDLIDEIVVNEPMPTAQQGKVTIFRRRTPDESRVPSDTCAAALYDFIRMLDAPTYPKAFIEWGGLRVEFDHAQRVGEDEIEARAIIRKVRSS